MLEDDISDRPSFSDITEGISALHCIDFWKDLPSDEEVEDFFNRKLTKGEIIDLVYRAALLGYRGYGAKKEIVDLRTTVVN